MNARRRVADDVRTAEAGLELAGAGAAVPTLVVAVIPRFIIKALAIPTDRFTDTARAARFVLALVTTVEGQGIAVVALLPALDYFVTAIGQRAGEGRRSRAIVEARDLAIGIAARFGAHGLARRV